MIIIRMKMGRSSLKEIIRSQRGSISYRKGDFEGVWVGEKVKNQSFFLGDGSRDNYFKGAFFECESAPQKSN